MDLLKDILHLNVISLWHKKLHEKHFSGSGTQGYREDVDNGKECHLCVSDFHGVFCFRHLSYLYN